MDPTGWSLCEAVSALKRGDVTAEAYAQALLAQCQAHQDLNAFITLDPGTVLEHARDADCKRASGAQLGPLHGVPLVIKDNFDVAGYPTTAGTPALHEHRPNRTAPVVQALLDAGAIILGKTNMHELAYGLTSHNPTFGDVRNPYDRNRSPGGSSGGTAAAIAARMSSAGLGSDTSGSIRVPAAHCGIVGFRPSMGRYSQVGIVPLSHTRDTAGPMARTVADIALLNQVITAAPSPKPANLKHVRIGVPRRHFYEKLDPNTNALIENELANLRELGVTLIEADLPDLRETYTETARPITNWELPRDFAAYLTESGSDLIIEDVVETIASPDVKPHLIALLTTDTTDESAYGKAIDQRLPAVRSAFADYFSTHGVTAIVFPTTALAAPPLGAQETVPHLGEQTSIWIYLRNAVPASLTGGPGLSLPIGLTPDGLPVGLELDALQGQDTDLLAIALAWENQADPPVPPTL